ncbi:MAG: serine/threonine protein kinase [Myxococcales bacterium]|nr:serine/threonine protein kinase [Myxococcales bacterium]
MIDVGQVLDKYELLARVGQGGMAVVYRGIDHSLKREVAVKVLHRHLAEHAEARDRFEREAHAVAKLRHENILEIFAYSGKESPESYIVTEFIDGATLKQFVTDHPPRFAEIGAMVVAEIGRALAHAHGHGVLHRDVKPENVMIRSDGVVKLTDFGISQMVDAQRMTVTGQLLGSPAYMSPEHVLGHELDFRTDVFAAGIVLYQLTVGKLPFDGKNPHEILKRIAECKYVDPRQANPRVGGELGRIIVKAMAADPADRYPTMTAMVADLEGYLDGSGLGTPKDELARYFAAPAVYEVALGQRLVDHLLRRAKAELPTRHALALDLLDRVLTIDPDHEGARLLLASIERRHRWRRVAVGVGLVVLAGGGGWGLRHALRGGATPRPAIDAAVAADAAVDAPPPVDAGALDAGDLDASAEPIDADVDAPIDDPGPRRADAHALLPAPPEDAAAARTFTLSVSPPDAEVRIGEGPWQRYLGGHAELPAPTAATGRTVRRDDCCEPSQRRVGPESAGGRIAIALGFLPAQLTPRCARADVQVEIDGHTARLDKPTLITFGGALTQRQVTVRFIGDTITSQKVTVRYAEAKEVTCAP